MGEWLANDGSEDEVITESKMSECSGELLLAELKAIKRSVRKLTCDRCLSKQRMTFERWAVRAVSGDLVLTGWARCLAGHERSMSSAL